METSNVYQKHLNLSKRIIIEKMLTEGANFKTISEALGKSNRTISYEVLKHREKIPGLKINNKTFTYCPKTDKPPYVCNGCPIRKGCRKTKYIYSAENANMDYKDLLSKSRLGIDLTNDEFINMNRIITEDIKNGHSFYMICRNHKNEFPVGERTLYNYVEKDYLDIINLDLPRKVRYKKRKKKQANITKDTKHRIGRSYEDFKEYINKNKYSEIVEMDTVEGIKGENEAVLLTLLWRRSNLLIAIKLDSKTCDNVTNAFNIIKEELGMELFHRYFQVILTDNGIEFSNPYDIENNGPDVLKSHVFYCDPKQSQQKGKIEVAHEYIRKYIPKSTSFNDYTQGDIDLMINHINNTVREKLVKEYGDLYDTPFKLHRTIVERKFFDVFDLYYIDSKDIILNKKIFKKDN